MVEQPNAEYIDRERQIHADTRDTSGDVSQARSNEMARTQVGELNLPFDVRSVYDSRPVLGTDFNLVVSVLSSSGSSAFTFIDASFAVPPGQICVLREITVWADPPPVLATQAGVSITAQVNGVGDPYTHDVPVGSGTTWPIKCFILADENQTVGVRFLNNAAIITTTLNARLYGNFLDKTGRPLQFEIANPAGGPRPGSK